MLSLSHFTESLSPTPQSPQFSTTIRPVLLRLVCPLSHKKAAHPAPTFFPQPHTPNSTSQLHMYTRLFTRLTPSTRLHHSFTSPPLALDIGLRLRHTPSTSPSAFNTPTSTSTSISPTRHLPTLNFKACTKLYQNTCANLNRELPSRPALVSFWEQLLFSLSLLTTATGLY